MEEKKHVKLDKSRLRHSFSMIYSLVFWNEGDWTLSVSVLLFKWDEISTQHRSSVNHKSCSILMELSFYYSDQRYKDSLTVFYDCVNFMADLFSKIVSFSSKSNFLPWWLSILWLVTFIHTTCNVFYMMLTEVKTHDNKVVTTVF